MPRSRIPQCGVPYCTSTRSVSSCIRKCAVSQNTRSVLRIPHSGRAVACYSTMTQYRVSPSA
eukprot:626520-Rhodomonas_salina.4